MRHQFFQGLSGDPARPLFVLGRNWVAPEFFALQWRYVWPLLSDDHSLPEALQGGGQGHPAHGPCLFSTSPGLAQFAPTKNQGQSTAVSNPLHHGQHVRWWYSAASTCIASRARYMVSAMLTVMAGSVPSEGGEAGKAPQPPLGGEFCPGTHRRLRPLCANFVEKLPGEDCEASCAQ